MGENESNILHSVIDKTSSELILYTIVIVVALAVVAIPLYVLSNKNANKREDKLLEICRESRKAITAYAKEAAKLNVTLTRIHDRIDGLFSMITDQSRQNDDIEKDLTKLNVTIRRVHTRIDDIYNKINEQK